MGPCTVLALNGDMGNCVESFLVKINNNFSHHINNTQHNYPYVHLVLVWYYTSFFRYRMFSLGTGYGPAMSPVPFNVFPKLVLLFVIDVGKM